MSSKSSKAGGDEPTASAFPTGVPTVSPTEDGAVPERTPVPDSGVEDEGVVLSNFMLTPPQPDVELEDFSFRKKRNLREEMAKILQEEDEEA